MGGYMSWPRFRGRNGLGQRPNYYSGSPDAPSPVPSALVYEGEVSRTYLSGEIDRMVYGWWKSERFQNAVAEEVGVSREQVAGVIHRMLTWDYIGNEVRPEWAFDG